MIQLGWLHKVGVIRAASLDLDNSLSLYVDSKSFGIMGDRPFWTDPFAAKFTQ